MKCTVSHEALHKCAKCKRFCALLISKDERHLFHNCSNKKCSQIQTLRMSNSNNSLSHKKQKRSVWSHYKKCQMQHGKFINFEVRNVENGLKIEIKITGN